MSHDAPDTRPRQGPAAPAAGDLDGAAPEEVDAEVVPEESPPETPEEAAAAELVEEDLETLRSRASERDEYLALAQRTQADFENYRKRMARDAAAAADRGVRRLAEELFGALDHLDAALQNIGDPDVVKGVRLVQDEFVNALRRVGVEPFSPVGEPFDPNEHEAMAQQPAEGFEPGQVVSVYQQGYRHKDQVIRPARVVVAS